MSQFQDTLSPIDGSVYVSRALADDAQIARVLAEARGAQRDWAATPLAQRQAICTGAVAYLLAQREDIALELCWMMGRPLRYAASEVAGLAERASYMIAAAPAALAPLTLAAKPGFSRYIQHEPLGLVFVIAPWNYPYLTAINSLVPALLAGNCVLLKHSAQTPLCAERLYAAFEAAGLPPGVLSYLHLNHEATTKIIASGAVNHVAFTGSVTAGALVERAAAGRFIGLGLELGGKDPAYVRHDAELDGAVASVVDGAFFNSGQSCCAIERVYVHADIYDAFVARAVASVKAYRLGRSDDPQTTLGPLVNAAAADFVRGQIQEALAQGAVAHIDEALFPLSRPGTPYLAPQLLTQVNHGMRLMTQESFGPVVGIMKVAGDEEALTLMNDSEFGLSASIFTRDIVTGIALGERLETGTFFINRCDYLDPGLAWTGVKQSGRGCSLSELGFGYLTRPKSFHIKHQC
ncbi:aldehyde dehydrogenase family protein [Shewanella salipaludis]|uniref:Aldehyde dehydrogenase family protein n=1 Tax=Shewanella salipaludis TaxID=2723052 RepID=A0A972FQ97_9GAMM|nr:aldehyde dehydrogenase family protein [Shewanella salipaludis]NMH64158.1 aldehyde dehydrogenase family protein [Shewanella salipaludis]